MYDYRMVPFQGSGAVKKVGAWQQTADQLRDMVLRGQSEGWEFVSVEHMTHYEPPGCFSGTSQPILRQVDIVVFRRRIG